MSANFTSLKELLSQPIQITITTHQKPDGDAMGSSLALYNYLIQFHHRVKVIVPTEFPKYFNWMPGVDEILIYPNSKIEADEWIQSSDLICCLDFNTISRIHPMDEIVKIAQKPILLIDHHLQPDSFQWMFHDIAACSTCELIYRFIHELDEHPSISELTAQCIYTGILTDTGNFQNGATNRNAFLIVADLLSKGLNIQYIQEQLNQSSTESKLRFLGNALLNKLTVRKDLGIAFIVVDKKDAKTYNLQAGDTEGLVNYPLSIQEINISVLIKEEREITKLSFRSKGDINVNDFARTHFEGGGHKNAAGGKSIFPPDWLIKKITELIEKDKKKNK
ncbi:MAG: DHH family phosphoesterase [Chitinophagales bacterium]|nr:DHH family phosphoesterase [Chitinophagales bacterium]MCZ2392889.1 DHH family phosphoesterase [Chitinophagales bacterium]